MFIQRFHLLVFVALLWLVSGCGLTGTANTPATLAAEIADLPPDQQIPPADAELLPEDSGNLPESEVLELAESIVNVQKQLTEAHSEPEQTPEGAKTAEANSDIWERLRNSMQLDLPTDEPDVLYFAVKFTQNPQIINSYLRYAHRYMHYILEQVTARGLPGEIALLPVIESALNPRAYSRVGASGLWQFIFSTAKHRKMKYNWWYDERRSVIDATHEGLDYLEELYAKFGDWPLAIAAYNAGPGRIQGAVNAYANKSYWEVPVLEETRGYIPRLIALAHIIKHPDLFDIALPRVPDAPYFEVLDIPANIQIDLEKLATLIGADKDELLQMNAQFRRRITEPGEHPEQILVPLTHYQQALQLYNQAKFGRNSSQNPVSIRYRVQSNDTLEKIAKRYDTDPDTLRKLNNMRSTNITRGRWLVIPFDNNTIIYTVRRGDNLSKIAYRHGVSIRTLARWNGLDSRAYLQPGQQLRLTPGGGGNAITHKVAYGESLGRLAQRYSVSVASIKAWNGMRGDRIQIGQTLKIYPPGYDNGGNGSSNRPKVHTVVSGDSLSTIAQRYRLSVRNLKKWNGLNGDVIRIGQAVKLQP